MGYPVSALGRYERELYEFFDGRHPDLLARLRDERNISDDLEAKLVAAMKDFGKIFKP